MKIIEAKTLPSETETNTASSGALKCVGNVAVIATSEKSIKQYSVRDWRGYIQRKTVVTVQCLLLNDR